MNVVVLGDWETVCVNPSQPPDPSKKLFGTVVDEGLLDYLSKIVVLHSNGDWGIMNFDERYYTVLSEKECMPLRDVWVKRTVATTVDDDPDGIPFAMTTFELRQRQP
ncbi:hypothetical protein DFO46_1797 [Rhizobium sp. AG855]|nr:hypothetical protein DFO46_1797 [Rhizobium sp. AG855]